ncbi:MAG: hypothetical protein ACPGLV_04510 [Bacteroidia bacterium]
MKRKHFLFLTIIACGIIIFQFSIAFKYNEKQSLKRAIKGVWVETNYSSGTYEFTRSKKFLAKNPGMWFNENGKMQRRANVGWCGTPPISYKNYNGVWTLNPKDSTLHAIYEFWSGKFDNTFKIKSISANELVLKTLEQKTIKE